MIKKVNAFMFDMMLQIIAQTTVISHLLLSILVLNKS